MILLRSLLIVGICATIRALVRALAAVANALSISLACLTSIDWISNANAFADASNSLNASDAPQSGWIINVPRTGKLGIRFLEKLKPFSQLA